MQYKSAWLTTIHFVPHKCIWNIWTRIKWEAKLTNLSEIFGRGKNERQSWKFSMKCKCYTSHWNFAVVQWEVGWVNISLWEPEKWPEQATNGCSKCSPFSFGSKGEWRVFGVKDRYACKKSGSLLWKRPIRSSPAVGCVEKWTTHSIVAQIQGIRITLRLRWTPKANLINHFC